MVQIDTRELTRKCQSIRSRANYIRRARTIKNEKFERKDLIGNLFNEVMRRNVTRYSMDTFANAIASCNKDFSTKFEVISPSNFIRVLEFLMNSNNQELLNLINESAILYKLSCGESDMKEWTVGNDAFQKQFDKSVSNQREHDKEVDHFANFDFVTHETRQKNAGQELFDIMTSTINQIIDELEGISWNYELLSQETNKVMRALLTNFLVGQEFTSLYGHKVKLKTLRDGFEQNDWVRVNAIADKAIVKGLLEKAKRTVIEKNDGEMALTNILSIIDDFVDRYSKPSSK